ncbi:MAG TPA: hypothetical protein VIN07_00140 [Flavipsychrobacter sp.]
MDKILNEILQPSFWTYFFILFACMLGFSTIMDVLATRFITVTRIARKFTIFDLEFTATPGELATLIRGIDKLEDKVQSGKVKKALRLHLFTDFLFMFCVYPGIAMLCIKTASKMAGIGEVIFLGLAIAQIFAWLLDIIENIYLLNKLRKPEISTLRVHRLYKRLVITKWGIAISGAICSVCGLLYFWIMGEFSPPSALVPFVVLAIMLIWAFANSKVMKAFAAK